MAFYKFTGPAAEHYSVLGLTAHPGYVYDFGSATPPTEDGPDASGRPVTSYWTSDPGPATDYRVVQAADLGTAAASSGDAAVFLVDTYRQAGDVDDGAAVTRAVAALKTRGSGVLKFNTGTYTLTSLSSPVLFTPSAAAKFNPFAVQGAGKDATTIKYAGSLTGPLFQWYNFYFDPNNASGGGAKISGFTLDGTGSSGAAGGILFTDYNGQRFEDVAVRNFTTGDGMSWPNMYGWTEEVVIDGVEVTNCSNLMHFTTGLSWPLGTITTAIPSGTPVTSIAVAGGVQKALYSGQAFVIYNGTASETFTTSAGVSAGATAIPVTSKTPTLTYAANTSGAYWGGYNSFDYWRVQKLYLGAQANQSGIVSEVPLGLYQNINRVGSTWSVTGNFQRAATNTGYFLWCKGNDNWDGSVVWDVACETDGSGATRHGSLRLDTSNAWGGVGRFQLFDFNGCTFAGGSWQVSYNGELALNGISDSAPTWSNRHWAYDTTRSTINGVNPNTDYNFTFTTATAVKNTTGRDYLVVVPITFTATGTAQLNVDTFSGVTAGGTTLAAGGSGTTYPLTFIHYRNTWARIDVTNATIGAAKAMRI